MPPWISIPWLGFIIARYASTALKSLRAPVVAGDDLQWASAWLMFLLAVAISSMALKPKPATRLWFALFAIATVVLLVLSHTWMAAIIATVVVFVAAGCGELFLQRVLRKAFTGDPPGFLERMAIAVPLGIAPIALTQLAFGLAGLFNRTTSWLIVIAYAIPAVSGIRSLFRQPIDEHLGNNPMLSAPILWIVLLNTVWAIAPEVQFDALSVHLAVPRIYLEQGKVIDLPYFMHSYFVHLIDMIFGLCMATGGQQVAKFLILELGIIALGGIFAMGRKLFNAEVGLWAALIFYSIPQVVWLSGTTYVDLAETTFIIGAILAFLRWMDNGETGWLIATACIAGVAIGVKFQATTLLAPLPLAMAWFSRTRSKSSPIRTIGIFVLVAAIVAVPWYAVIYAFTGNPFFPFMNGVFRSPQWEIENTRLDADSFGIGVSVAKTLRLPFWLTWDTIRFGPDLPRGGLGFAMLLTFPLAFIAPFWNRRYRSASVVILLLCVALHFILWAITFQYGRYYVPSLPLVALLGSALFLTAQGRLLKLNRVLLFAGIVVQTPISSLMFWNIPERYPIQHALGVESDDKLLSRAVWGFNATKYINTVIRPGERVLGIGMEQSRLYLNAPLESLGEASRGQRLQALAEKKGDAQIVTALSEMGIAYVITPLADLRQPAAYYPWLQPEFVNRYERQVYRNETVAVLKLCSENCRQEMNLLQPKSLP